MEKRKSSKRLRSLDALRGFDMFFITGGCALFFALQKLYPNVVLNAITEQMEHVPWHGFHFQDMIFPLFLFIAGISFPFSLAKQRERGKSERQIYLKVIRRGLTLVLFGILYNDFLLHFDFSTQRYCSVLGRIGLAWMFAALITIKTSTKQRMFIVPALLVGYWLALRFIPVPGYIGTDPFSMDGSLVGYVDRMLMPGSLYLKIHDPEGLLGTIPAIGTALLGMFTGEYIKLKKTGYTEMKKVGHMSLAGVGLIVVGLLWSLVFPLNKNLWTSSFVCLVGGISLLLFALFYYIIDVKGYYKWSFFFVVIGMNPITIYLGSKFISFDFTARSLLTGLASYMPADVGSLVILLGTVTVQWLFLYYLYKNKIFLKV